MATPGKKASSRKKRANCYPFGLTMAGISDEAIKDNYAVNKYRFIGQLYDDDLSWDTYQMKYRTMDPQVGRFWQTDPLANKYVHNSTYAYAENRVVNGIDLEGAEYFQPSYSGAMSIAHAANPATVTQADVQAAKETDQDANKVNAQVTIPLMLAATMQPEVAIPFMLSYLSGVPVTPSPQAMEGMAASEGEGMAAEGVTVSEGTTQAVSGMPAEGATSGTSAAGDFTLKSGPSSKLSADLHSPDFIVDAGGQAFPVPSGATGPTPVINPAGKQTGVAFTGGTGGENGQVSTMRMMDATPPRGKSPGYPNGYIEYQKCINVHFIDACRLNKKEKLFI